MTSREAVVLCMLALGACGKKKNEGAAPTAGSGSGSSAGGSAGSDGTASGDPTTSAAGGELSAAKSVTECPKSLGGTERGVNRVITKACGVVPVTATYSFDGGMLTLEAGATLAFADGASLSIGYYEPAKLVVKGTKDGPVTLTASGDKVPGAWQGVRLYPKAARSSIEGLVIEHAGGDDKGALYVDTTDLALKGSTVTSSKTSNVVTSGQATLTEFSGNTLGATTEGPSMSVNPTAAGSLAPGNQFPAGAWIRIEAGTIAKSVTWNNPGAPFAVLEDVAVDGKDGARATLQLSPGVELRLDQDSELQIGYYGQAALLAVGTKEAPIKFTAFEAKEPGGWSGVQLFSKGQGTFEHVMFEHGGAVEDKATVFGANNAALSIKSSTFKDCKIGVRLEGELGELKAFDDNTFSGTPLAVSLFADTMRGLGSGNQYQGDTRIELRGGAVKTDATWKTQDTVVQIVEDVAIDKARLTIEAGARFAVKDAVSINVGYYDLAGLQLLGTTDKPIRFAGLRDVAEGWETIALFSKARDNVIEHVELANTGGTAGVKVDGNSDLKVTGLSCRKCAAAALTWACGAKVTATDVKGIGGTATGEAKPTCN